MKKESDLHYFYLWTVKIIQKSEDHNFGTEHARNVKFVSKCAVLDTLPYSTNNSILTKVDLGPFGNELSI